ncbi:hypothetical protein [Spiroplasma turonicum]|uniref:PIN domain-containing protein n=1 Tax=Spiroplasma turonicum TaxID=216946 RepID=A0A0K1P6F7_9MOLU|nr:hypothetical protein [Spiroplasma turonicum]AKU79901.1 hypothetical protein STURON_00655 [Spiroplasma turonicum]ALX70913.1 hypothetical protein STURO_v1c06540 [Spiroplasma turonicum]
MENIIIDLNIILDIFDLKNKRKCISEITKESLLKLINKGKNFNLIIAGKKMFNEMTGFDNELYNDASKINFINLLKYKTYSSDSINLVIDINNDNLNNKIESFIVNNWKVRKDQVYTKRLKGDPHIIFVAYEYKVKYLFTRDVALAKKINKNFIIYFKNANLPKVFCKCFLQVPNNFYIDKEIVI